MISFKRLMRSSIIKIFCPDWVSKLPFLYGTKITTQIILLCLNDFKKHPLQFLGACFLFAEVLEAAGQLFSAASRRFLKPKA